MKRNEVYKMSELRTLAGVVVPSHWTLVLYGPETHHELVKQDAEVLIVDIMDDASDSIVVYTLPYIG